MVAYYACLYYGALRPEEVSALNKRHLDLPEAGWGWFHLDGAEPYAGKEWTNTGKNRDQRQLNQRERGETRSAPCPPELTALIHAHVKEFGFAPDGRLFRGERNGEELPKGTIAKTWRPTRAEVFTPGGPRLPARGHTLRPTPRRGVHVAQRGVPATNVAEWAGHSVEILLKIYAKCLDGGTEVLRQRVQQALGHGPA